MKEGALPRTFGTTAGDLGAAAEEESE
jgi:hypothetical protein